MLIGIDAHTIGHQATGNETYIANLVRALSEIDAESRYRLFVTKAANGLASSLPANFSVANVSRNAWVRFGLSLPRRFLTERLDLMHFQYVVPPLVRCPVVVTIHDISYVRIPEQLRPDELFRVRRLFPASAARAARILTATNAVAQDIVDHLDVSPEKVVVVPYGVGPQYRVLEDREGVASALRLMGLEPGYLLFVSMLQPRKNVGRLIRAYGILRRRHGIAEKLVIAGKPTLLDHDVGEIAREEGVADDVVFAGHVSDADLPILYNGAKVFVCPSLYEGFGFPPLEAMACGVPVVASSAPVLPEVLGDAAQYVEPTDVESIAQGIHRVLVDGELAAALVRKGLERAGRFTWIEAATKTLEVYRQVASGVNG